MKRMGSAMKRLKMKNDFNTNDLVYGLSGYVGWGATSIYAKYDLKPYFPWIQT
jgi:hypothetical protein